MRNEIGRALDALQNIDASCSRNEWIAIGMAAKSAGLGFEDFHNWSMGGSNYVSKKDCLTTWTSFKNNGAITVATIFKCALEQGWKDDSFIRSKNLNIKVPKPTQSKNGVASKDKRDITNNTNAQEIWDRCIPASLDHPYISRKKGNTEGLRVYPTGAAPLSILGQDVSGYLVVPCWTNGVLQTLQFIPPVEGKKLNLPGSSFNDGCFIVGNAASANHIYICEGIGAAWACASATGEAATVCFGSGRMQKVSNQLRQQFVRSHLVIVADKGKEKQAEAIATEVNGSFIKMPDDSVSNFDANDFSSEFGDIALTHLLCNQRNTAPMRYKLLSGADLYNAPAMQWLIRGLLPKTGLAALYGPSGSGKSFLMLDIACALAGDHHE